MRFWLDCEFNGYKGELISIALVDEQGHCFYSELHHDHMILDPWVQENVISKIQSNATQSLQDAKIVFEKWASTYNSMHIIADWPDDIKYFCNFLITGPGMRLNTPPLTMAIRRDLSSDASETPHHALEDAIALRRMHLELEKSQ